MENRLYSLYLLLQAVASGNPISQSAASSLMRLRYVFWDAGGPPYLTPAGQAVLKGLIALLAALEAEELQHEVDFAAEAEEAEQLANPSRTSGSSFKLG